MGNTDTGTKAVPTRKKGKGNSIYNNENHYLSVSTLDKHFPNEPLPEEILEKIKGGHEERSRDDFQSPFDNIPGFSKPTDKAIVNTSEVRQILQKEGFNVDDEQISALNFFNSPIGAFQYALYYFGIVDFYIVLMINKRKGSVYGYHVIDLSDQYSLSEDLSNRMKTGAVIF